MSAETPKPISSLTFLAAFLAMLLLLVAGELQEHCFKGQSPIPVFFASYIQLFISVFLFGFFVIKGVCFDNTTQLESNEKESSQVLIHSLLHQILLFYNNHYAVIRKAVIVSPAFFGAVIISNYGFKYVSVALNNAYFQSNLIFTYFLGVVFFGKLITVLQTIGVLFCLVGMILIIWVDSSYSLENFDNYNLIVFGAALFFAIYSLLYSEFFSHRQFQNGSSYQQNNELSRISQTSRASIDGLELGSSNGASVAEHNVSTSEDRRNAMEETFLVYSVFGLLALVTLWPIALILTLTGAEPFYNNSLSIFYMFVLAVLTLCYNLLFSYAFAYAPALTVNMIQAFGILFAMIADNILYGTTYTSEYAGGIVLILAGFVVVTFESQLERKAIELYAYLVNPIR